MKRLQRLAGAGLLALGAVVFVAPAQADTVFTVAEIPVDAKAAGASEARTVAIDQGRQVAYQIIAKRLVPESAWGVIPDLSLAEVADLGAGYEVITEKNSTTRYIATITYSFRPAAIRSLLKQRNVPFSETQAPLMVVFPVLTVGDDTRVWKDPNPWREAWANRNLINALTPVISPLGDLSDLSTAPESLAATSSFAAFKPLADKYGALSVLVARATQAAPDANIIVNADRLTSGGSQSFSVSVPVSGDPERAFAFAVDELVGRMQEVWRQQTLVADGPQSRLPVTAEFTSLSEWLRLRRALEATPSIAEVDVIAVATGSGRLILTHSGTTDRLAFILAQRQIGLNNVGPVSPIPAPEPTLVTDPPNALIDPPRQATGVTGSPFPGVPEGPGSAPAGVPPAISSGPPITPGDWRLRFGTAGLSPTVPNSGAGLTPPVQSAGPDGGRALPPVSP